MTRVLRYEVPVDGGPHRLDLPGPILHVASRHPAIVEVWCQDDGPPRSPTLQVVGTGHEWPRGALHLGTAIVPGGTLVWHLLAVPA